MIEHKALMASFLRGGVRPPGVSDEEWDRLGDAGRTAAAWAHLRDSPSLEDRKMVLQILEFPNALQRLAGMYNEGLLDDGVLKLQVETQAKDFVRKAVFWLTKLRDENEGYLADIDTMIFKLAEKPRSV